MPSAQNVFFLLKSDPKASSSEIARSVRKLPGVKELWMTEGEYSFVARFSVPECTIQLLESKISSNPRILETSCLTAPILL